MLEWLIIGGGIHGTHISALLTQTKKVPNDRIRVLDPYPEPLSRWNECTENCGMSFLRSPDVHHIDLHPFALHYFSKSPVGKPFANFTWPYDRPSLELFQIHCKETIKKYRLEELRLTGRATGISQHSDSAIRVETTSGAIEARRVVIAISLSEQPQWPDWAKKLKAEGANIDHIFQPGFKRSEIKNWRNSVIIGGGITAAQTAMAIAENFPGEVTLLSRHSIREHQFDSDPEWIGQRYMSRFLQQRDYTKRRAMIQQARHRGSMPPDVVKQLKSFVRRGLIRQLIGTVEAASTTSSKEILLKLAEDSLKADRIILATGFEPVRPGGDWLERAISDLDLKCASCGYPIVDRSLKWHPGIYVSGPLAELELGPTARNIIGARTAAEKLLKVD